MKTEMRVVTAREKKPDASEHLPYYGRYIALVPEGDVVSTLESQFRDTHALLAGIPAGRSTHRYAAGKWSINEVVGHIIDSERIFSVRALRFARADATPIPGFEQDDYVKNASFDSYPLAELVAELECVRRSTVLFFRHLTEEAWMRRGVANNAEITVRALAWIIAGHELHHREILGTRYF